jgi:hypothetical protein
VFSLYYRARYLVAATILATSACAGIHAVPTSGIGPESALAVAAPDAVDTTSILKQLTKTVLIGSTVDAKNGDKAPHGLLIARTGSANIKKGQLVACNFSNKSNAAGKGTTIEALNAKAGSAPTQLAQNAAAAGCAALGITQANTLLDATFSAKSIASFDSTGAYAKIKSRNIVAPFGATYSSIGHPYPRLILFATDAAKGTILRIDMTNPGPPQVTPVASGFAVNKKGGTAALGPSGLSYNVKTDTLYIVDGVDNTLIAFKKFGQDILLTNAVTVLPGGKTFKYAKGIKPFASVVYSGSALKSPVASTLLPNGNLVVANTKGSSLVEITTAGAVLATKVVAPGTAPTVFGLAASGTTDANTVLYFTNAVSSTVQELTR